MERETAKSVREKLEAYFSSNPRFKEGLINAKVLSAWNKTVGHEIELATRSKHFANGVLYCSINSSVLRNVLMQNKLRVISEINRVCGEELVKTLVLR